MVNVLVAIDDETKTDRIASVLKNASELNCAFFSDSSKAMEYAVDNDIDIAVIAVDLSILDGNELSETIIDRNMNCRFVFIFKENNISKAIEMFNFYEDSRLIEYSVSDGESIRFMLTELTETVNSERKLKTELSDLNEKQKSYKHRLSEMSSVLNTRVACYKNIIKTYLFSAESALSVNNIDDSEKIISFFQKELDEYVKLSLSGSFSFSEFLSSLPKRYCEKKDTMPLIFTGFDSLPETDSLPNIAFAVLLLCDAFNEFMIAYRGKVNCSEIPTGYKLDAIFNADTGHTDPGVRENVSMIINPVIKSLSAKVEYAHKDNTTQYRIHFGK